MKFPKNLYVAIDGDKGQEFFLADNDPKGLALTDDVRKVAVYKLERIADLKNKSTLE